MKQNLPGGDSAVVPPDPMPNSEVKRRSADGSVGSPHVRVGNCQASNKTKGSVERLGLLFYLLFAGKHSPGQDVRHKQPGIKSVRSPSSRTGFLRFNARHNANEAADRVGHGRHDRIAR